MFLSKESLQSARIFGRVLNSPLYDGDCSSVARTLLADGDGDGAIAEWRRLADLGSGRARCVLAYIALKGAPSAAPDLEEARRLASSAISGERGYANYLLACVALKEGRASTAIKLLADSHKSGFLPAATLLALMAPDLEEARRLASSALGGESGYANYVLGCIALKEGRASHFGQHLLKSLQAGFAPAGTLLASTYLQGKKTSLKVKVDAETMLRKAAAAGHCPARVLLCGFYVRGRFGFWKRILGSILLPAALIRFAMSAKYRVFSIHSFHYPTRLKEPLFVSGILRPQEDVGTTQLPRI